MMVESSNSRKEADGMEGTATISLDTLDELRAKAEEEEASDEHLDIAKASQKELKQIQVVLKE